MKSADGYGPGQHAVLRETVPSSDQGGFRVFMTQSGGASGVSMAGAHNGQDCLMHPTGGGWYSGVNGQRAESGPSAHMTASPIAGGRRNR